MTRVKLELRFEDLMDDIINKLSPEDAKAVFEYMKDRIEEVME